MPANPANRGASNRGRALLVGALSTCVLATCCTITAFQDKLLNVLDADGLSLIEIGSYGRMRAIRFKGLSFEARKLADHSVLVGVSTAGDLLLVNTRSGQNQYSERSQDEVDILTPAGQPVTRIRANVRGMTIYDAALSPDRQSIAFVGSITALSDGSVSYGLHLLSASGELQTLVPTTQIDVPQSIGWSPDGKAIVYDSDNNILLYRTEKRVSSFLIAGNNPTWAPNGLWIAYRRPNGIAALVNPDGKNSKEILHGVQLGRGLRWSPDSRCLLFADFSIGAIRVFDLATGRIATLFHTVDQYDANRLRWIRGLPH